jgi:hypothetical protein
VLVISWIYTVLNIDRVSPSYSNNKREGGRFDLPVNEATYLDLVLAHLFLAAQKKKPVSQGLEVKSQKADYVASNHGG